MSDDLPPDLEDFSGRFTTKLEESKKTNAEKEDNNKAASYGGLLEVPEDNDVPFAASAVPFKHKLDETAKGSTMPISVGEGADIKPVSGDKKSSENGTTEKPKEERKFLTDWGTPEQEAIQKLMIDAALANTPDAKREMRELELSSVQGFLKNASVKKGFLNRSKPAPKKTSTASSSSSASKNDVIEVKIDPAKAAAEKNALLSRDVQEQLRSQLPAMEKKLTNGSWMTEDFLQRISKDPSLMTGMSNPRWMEALKRMRTEPEKVMKEYQNDKGFQDWIMKFMGIMGDQFTRLGEQEDVQKQYDQGGYKEPSSSSAAPSSSSSGLVPVATRKVLKKKPETAKTSKTASPPSESKVGKPAKGASNKAKSNEGGEGSPDEPMDGEPAVDDSDLDDENFDSISVAGVSCEPIDDDEGWGSDSSVISTSRAYGPYVVPQPFAKPGNMFEQKKGLLAPEGPSSNYIAAAAKAGALQGVDEDVKQILTNPELVETLRDPAVHRMLEECRMDGRAMRKYAKDPAFARKLMLLQQAGLIRIEI